MSQNSDISTSGLCTGFFFSGGGKKFCTQSTCTKIFIPNTLKYTFHAEISAIRYLSRFLCINFSHNLMFYNELHINLKIILGAKEIPMPPPPPTTLNFPAACTFYSCQKRIMRKRERGRSMTQPHT